MTAKDDLSLHEIGVDIAVMTYFGDIKEGPQVNQFAAALKDCGMYHYPLRICFPDVQCGEIAVPRAIE